MLQLIVPSATVSMLTSQQAQDADSTSTGFGPICPISTNNLLFPVECIVKSAFRVWPHTFIFIFIDVVI